MRSAEVLPLQFGSTDPAPPKSDKRFFELQPDSDETEDDLIRRNVAFTRGADGKLRVFSARHVPEPVKRGREDLKVEKYAEMVRRIMKAEKRDVVGAKEHDAAELTRCAMRLALKAVADLRG